MPQTGTRVLLVQLNYLQLPCGSHIASMPLHLLCVGTQEVSTLTVLIKRPCALTTQELNVCAVHLACALSAPQEVCGAVVPLARGTVLTGEGLLVVHQQAPEARGQGASNRCTGQLLLVTVLLAWHKLTGGKLREESTAKGQQEKI